MISTVLCLIIKLQITLMLSH